MRTLLTYSILFHILVPELSARTVPNQHILDRERILDEEDRMTLGGKIKLTEEEIKANRILMNWKHKEIDESFNDHVHFNMSKHFFQYYKYIEKSKVYQFIKKMPKGGALHVHASMMLDADSLLDLTYEDHLYACYADDDLKLHFAHTIPSQLCPYNWTLLSDLRNASDDVDYFDSKLRKHLTMFTDDATILNADINSTWKRFNKLLKVVKSMINYRPVREKFFYKALQNFYNDNVMYVEIRSGLSELYELDGSVHSPIYLAELYRRIANKFTQDHPDFVGVKLIVTTSRWKDVSKVINTLEICRKLKNTMPDFFAGFDLVGQEDFGKPLLSFLPLLEEMKGEIDFYFHGGETNWFGTSSDENLIDAVLLGSKRIGHAYALLKHPKVLAEVVKKDIALEVNVISNVVLSLVRDVRNHPLATYLALGYPVVVSSDDPGVWEADPLSHDFYVTFMGVASKRADLKILKQLALNSIRYSALDESSKSTFYKVLDKQWNIFICEFIDEYSR